MKTHTNSARPAGSGDGRQQRTNSACALVLRNRTIRPMEAEFALLAPKGLVEDSGSEDVPST